MDLKKRIERNVLGIRMDDEVERAFLFLLEEKNFALLKKVILQRAKVDEDKSFIKMLKAFLDALNSLVSAENLFPEEKNMKLSESRPSVPDSSRIFGGGVSRG